MAKPHTSEGKTTLSEAVRALELPEHSARVESQNETGSMATVWMNMTHGLLRDTKIYTEDQVRAVLSAAAELVEQHEAQEPKLPTDLSHRLRETADQQPGWKPLLTAAADEIERYYGGMMNWKSAAEAKDSLAATQAGDAKDAARYRWLRERDWFDGELCVLRNPKKVLTSGSGFGADCPSHDRLDAAIDAAMSPTTTRSE